MKTVTLEDYKARMLRVLLFIQANLDRDLSLEELADVAHFSPHHFHRVFRGMTGETLHSHVRRIRLERAAQRLKYSSRPIVDIAFEAGYETHEAFTRAFGAMTGLAPSRYRKSARARDTDAPASQIHYGGKGRVEEFQPVDTGGSTMDVRIEKVDPVRVAFIRHVGPYDQVGQTWGALCARLGAQGLLGAGTRFLGLCHDDPEVTPADKIRYDACVAVGEDFEPEGEIGVQVIAGGEYAVTTHHGPYSTLAKTYAELYGQWMPRHGRVPLSGPCFEAYLNDPQSTKPEALLTDIFAPVEPKE